MPEAGGRTAPHYDRNSSSSYLVTWLSLTEMGELLAQQRAWETDIGRHTYRWIF